MAEPRHRVGDCQGVAAEGCRIVQSVRSAEQLDESGLGCAGPAPELRLTLLTW